MKCIEELVRVGSGANGNVAKEVGEMAVTIDPHDLVVEDGDGLDFHQVAWFLREKLSAFLDGDHSVPPELGLRTLLATAASRRIVSVDPNVMNPVLWKTLPKELLFRVLALLPLRDINRLRCLSREWNRDMNTLNSEMNRACDDAKPGMMAMISSSVDTYYDGFHVTLFDLSSRSGPEDSYALRMSNPMDLEVGWDTMGAIDGGLVCFVSTWKPSGSHPLSIVVMNLLTGVRRELPPLHFVYFAPPRMLHIQVNSETKGYSVVVVGKHVKSRTLLEIYDSDTGKWARAAPSYSSVFGLAYEWRYNKYRGDFFCVRKTPCVYDFAEGQVKLCTENNPASDAFLKRFLVGKDRMFVLNERVAGRRTPVPPRGRQFYIHEYQVQRNAKDWVQRRTFLRGHLPTFLCACEEFLMTKESHDCMMPHYWLLNLSTGEWWNRSDLPQIYEDEGHATLMSRAFWNVIP